ncbi:MAG: hypothetical protein ACOZBW_00995 [Thermodesulfobacteriota bacterium]
MHQKHPPANVAFFRADDPAGLSPADCENPFVLIIIAITMAAAILIFIVDILLLRPCRLSLLPKNGSNHYGTSFDLFIQIEIGIGIEIEFNVR